MLRQLEPELMDDHIQALAYSEADFSIGDQNFVENLKAFLTKSDHTLSKDCFLIDLGCGPGNITERLAETWPFAKVLGIDGSKPMLEIAKQRLHSSASRFNNLSYQQQNLSDITSQIEPCYSPADLIVSNSLLHHLHDPMDLWRSVLSLSVPGTLIYHRDLRRPQSRDDALVLQQKHLPSAPGILIRDFLASLHAAFTIAEVQIQLIDIGLQHLQIMEVEDRYLEVFGIV